MDEKIIKFDYIEIEKQKFHQYQGPILINDINISQRVVSNKVFFSKKGFKYFIGHKDAKKVTPFCIFLSKTTLFDKR